MTVPTLTSIPLLPGVPGSGAAPTAGPEGSPAVSTGTASAGTPGQGFGDLMSALLGQTAEGSTHVAPAALPGEAAPAEAAPAEAATTAPVPGSLPEEAEGTDPAAGDPAESSGADEQPGPAEPSPAGTPPTVVVAVTAPPVVEAGAVDAPAPAGPRAAPAGDAATGLTSGSEVPGAAEASTGGTGGTGGPDASAADPATGVRGPSADNGSGAVATTGLTGVAGTAQASSAPAVHGHTQTGSASPVTGQVYPEVARLVTRGDGTQRLTLRLSPDDLGDVRIVVTVRGGAVDVSLAAGAEAQEALRNGSSELRRLLEGVGALSTQIAVRDLPAAPTPAAQPAAGGAAHLDTADTGGDRSHDQTGDRPQHPSTAARDDAAGLSPSLPTDTATGARAAGLDLRL